VADGVGGNNAGEIASRTAVETCRDFMSINHLAGVSERDIGDLFDACLARANDSVVEACRQQPENRGMATTLVLCHVREDKAYFANVGDSRAYLYADGQLLQITEDHSYVNALIRMGVLTEEEARHHKRGHVITKAIGAELTVEGDQYDVEIREGDILLLCTDGLYGELSKEEIIAILQDDQDMQVLTERLVDRANQLGGRDNITAITVKVQGGNQNEQ
jgi:protein phosphatase